MREERDLYTLYNTIGRGLCSLLRFRALNISNMFCFLRDVKNMFWILWAFSVVDTYIIQDFIQVYKYALDVVITWVQGKTKPTTGDCHIRDSWISLKYDFAVYHIVGKFDWGRDLMNLANRPQTKAIHIISYKLFSPKSSFVHFHQILLPPNFPAISYVWSSTRFSSSKIWQKVCPAKHGEQDAHKGLRLPLARDDGNFQPFQL